MLVITIVIALVTGIALGMSLNALSDYLPRFAATPIKVPVVRLELSLWMLQKCYFADLCIGCQIAGFGCTC